MLVRWNIYVLRSAGLNLHLHRRGYSFHLLPMLSLVVLHSFLVSLSPGKHILIVYWLLMSHLLYLLWRVRLNLFHSKISGHLAGNFLQYLFSQSHRVVSDVPQRNKLNDVSLHLYPSTIQQRLIVSIQLTH